MAITASEAYSEWLLPPVVTRLRDVAPRITVDIVASNAIRDLKRREADIAIRNARPDQPDLIGKLICEDKGTLYATPACLARLGPVTSLTDLSRAEFVGFDDVPGYITALAQHGVDVSADQFKVTADSHLVHIALTRAGLGLGALPCPLGDADPALIRVLPDAPDFSYPVWLVAHRELRTNRRVRLVFDLLAEMLPRLLKA